MCITLTDTLLLRRVSLEGRGPLTGTCLGEMNEEWSQPADGACASSSSGDNCAIVANFNSRL